MPGFADRLQGVELSASASMIERARELRAAGHRIISLASGQPDFPTPDAAITAAYDAARRRDTRYPPQAGTPAFVEAVRRKFRRDNWLDYRPDEVLVGYGGKKQIVFNALASATEGSGSQVTELAAPWLRGVGLPRRDRWSRGSTIAGRP